MPRVQSKDLGSPVSAEHQRTPTKHAVVPCHVRLFRDFLGFLKSSLRWERLDVAFRHFVGNGRWLGPHQKEPAGV
jgi:hypothetical protein